MVLFDNPSPLSVVPVATYGYDLGSRMTLTFDVVSAKFCRRGAVVDPVDIPVVGDSGLVTRGKRTQVTLVLVLLLVFVLVDHNLAFVQVSRRTVGTVVHDLRDQLTFGRVFAGTRRTSDGSDRDRWHDADFVAHLLRQAEDLGWGKSAGLGFIAHHQG